MKGVRPSNLEYTSRGAGSSPYPPIGLGTAYRLTIISKTSKIAQLHYFYQQPQQVSTTAPQKIGELLFPLIAHYLGHRLTTKLDKHHLRSLLKYVRINLHMSG